MGLSIGKEGDLVSSIGKEGGFGVSIGKEEGFGVFHRERGGIWGLP